MFRLILLVSLHVISIRTLFAQAHDYTVNNGKYHVCLREGTKPGHGFIWFYSRENEHGLAVQGTYVLRDGTPKTLETSLSATWWLRVTDGTRTWVQRRRRDDAKITQIKFEWYDSDGATKTLTHLPSSELFEVNTKELSLVLKKGEILKLKDCSSLPEEDSLPPGLVRRVDFTNITATNPNSIHGGKRIFDRQHFGYVYGQGDPSGVVYLDFVPDPEKKNSGAVWMVFHDFSPPDHMIPKPPEQTQVPPTPDPVPAPISSSKSRSKSRTRSTAKPELVPLPPPDATLSTIDVAYAGHGWYSAEFTNEGVKVSLRFTRTFNHVSEDKVGEWRAVSAYRTGMDINFVLADSTVPDSPLAVMQEIFFIDDNGERMSRRVTGQGFLGLSSKEQPAVLCLAIHGFETLHFMEATAETVQKTPKLQHLLNILLTDAPPGFDNESLKQLSSQ